MHKHKLIFGWMGKNVFFCACWQHCLWRPQKGLLQHNNKPYWQTARHRIGILQISVILPLSQTNRCYTCEVSVHQWKTCVRKCAKDDLQQDLHTHLKANWHFCLDMMPLLWWFWCYITFCRNGNWNLNPGP